MPIGLFEDADGVVWLIDGRNRLEAAERAGIDPKSIPAVQVHCSDPATGIIALNLLRRHLTPQQQLELIVAVRMADNKPGHPVQVSKGGRGKVNPVKAAVIADAKAAGLDAGERSVRRAIAKAEGKKPKAEGIKRKRRTSAERERDISLTWIDGVTMQLAGRTFTDAAVDLLNKDQLEVLEENLPKAIKSLGTLREQVRERLTEVYGEA